MLIYEYNVNLSHSRFDIAQMYKKTNYEQENVMLIVCPADNHRTNLIIFQLL